LCVCLFVFLIGGGGCGCGFVHNTSHLKWTDFLQSNCFTVSLHKLRWRNSSDDNVIFQEPTNWSINIVKKFDERSEIWSTYVNSGFTKSSTAVSQLLTAWCRIARQIYRMRQKHLSVLIFKVKWKHFINTIGCNPCRWEVIWIITVWIWHTVGDHHIVHDTPAVAMERLS
jgi:hypothetical protein